MRDGGESFCRACLSSSEKVNGAPRLGTICRSDLAGKGRRGVHGEKSNVQRLEKRKEGFVFKTDRGGRAMGCAIIGAKIAIKRKTDELYGT